MEKHGSENRHHNYTAKTMKVLQFFSTADIRPIGLYRVN
jgi:hypothetical protein